MPCSNAVASVKGFHDEPGWRPEPPPVMLCPDQQVAATCTTAPLAGGGSQPPKASLTCEVVPKPRPPTRAGTKPALGSTVATAISRGGLVPARVASTAAEAAAWTAGSRVVCTRRPPP